ncbi:MAG: hypothetical protein NZ518_08155, partial [Dehalococcoidia bacterium]|nr:hypothetical protein [Dehalococcoidia bacterium]
MNRHVHHAARVAAQIILMAAVCGAIGAIVLPNASGALTLGSRANYDADQRAIQAAVDEYVRQAPANRPFPTFSGQRAEPSFTPAPIPRAGPYIDFSLITGVSRPLIEPPRSAGPLNASGVY